MEVSDTYIIISFENKIMGRITLKYPKLSLLLLIFIITVVFFYKGKTYPLFHNFLESLGYIGIFLGGFFYAYTFTSAPATAVLLILAKGQNIFLHV